MAYNSILGSDCFILGQSQYGTDNACAGGVEEFGAAALTATGTLAGAAVSNQVAAVALTATGTLSPDGDLVASGATTLTATGTLAAAGARIQYASTALTGSGTLSPDGDLVASVATSLTGTATLAAAPVANMSGATTLTATGTLAAAGTRIQSGATTLTGTATLAADGDADLTGAVALTADGDLAAAGTRIQYASVTLTADGDIEAEASGDGEASSTLTATATLSPDGDLVASGATTLTSTGTLATNAIGDFKAAAARTFDVTLEPSAQGIFGGAAELTSTATLSASPDNEEFAAVELTATGTLSAEAADEELASVSLTATATLGADAQLYKLLEGELIFRWEFNEGPWHYYRVQSQCISRACPPISDSSGGCQQGSQTTVIVLARSLTEVCRKLNNSGLVFPVQSVVRYDPGAKFDERTEGRDHTCRTLVDVTANFNAVADCTEQFLPFDVDMGELDIQFEATLDPDAEEFYEHTSTGGFTLSGSSDINVTFNPSDLFTDQSSGGLILGGTSTIASSIWEHTSSGGFTLGRWSEPNQFEVPQSPLKLVLGGQSESTITGTLELEILGENTTQSTMRANYAVIDADPLEGSEAELIGTICCPKSDTPVLANAAHDLGRIQGLAQFLRRNNFNIPNPISMTYSALTNLWQANLMYRGVSIGNNTQTTTWNIVMEFGCVTPVSLTLPLAQNESQWKFSLSVRNKNLTTGEDYQSRMLLYFDKADVCQATFPVSFHFEVDVQSLIVTPSPILTPVLHDGAGLFKSSNWYANPIFAVTIRPSVDVGTSTPYPELRVPVQNVRGSQPIRS